MTQPDPTAVLARIRQMADYWEQHLPEVIRTPAVVSAIRAALKPAVVPPADQAAFEADVGSQTGPKAASKDPTVLRDRIRRAVCEAEGFAWDSDMLEPDEYGEVADMVLAVLPPPVDRAAVLREAADELGRMDYDTDSNDYGYDTYRDAWNGGVMDGAEMLRRLAAETQQQETPSMRLAAASIRASITEAAEAGPEDVLEDAVALLREAATLYDAREQPESAALRIRVLSETLARLSGTRSEDSATEEIGAAQVRAVFREMLAEMDQRAGAQRQPDTETEGAACTCGRTACESDLCDCDATPCPVDHAAVEARQDGAQRPEVVHGCPPNGSGLTPCCGRTPFELPLSDRISTEAPVTCPGPAVLVQPAAADTDEEPREPDPDCERCDGSGLDPDAYFRQGDVWTHAPCTACLPEDDDAPEPAPERVKHSGPNTEFCVLCLSGEHERIDEETS